jgi:Spy/CpxP family protein refolding chaperone
VAVAQPPEGGPLGLWFWLLNHHAVRKELKLTDKQIKKVSDLAKDLREKQRKELANSRDMNPSERRQKFQELMTEIEERQKALAAVLTPDQEKRLHQLLRQRKGTAALLDPEVQSALKLSDEQKEKIKTIADKEMRVPFQSGPGGGILQKMKAIRKESMENATAVLTDEQKKTWKDLVGEPFDFLEMLKRPTGAGDR